MKNRDPQHREKITEKQRPSSTAALNSALAAGH